MTRKVLIYSDKPSLLHDLIGGAKALGEVSALVIGNDDAVAAAVAAGAANVYYLGDGAGKIPEEYTETMAKLIADVQPEVCIFGATTRGRAIAGRIAAKFNSSVLADVKAFEEVDGKLTGLHMIYGGGANLRQNSATATTFVIANFGVWEAAPAVAGAGNVVNVAFVEPAWSIKVVGQEKRPPASVNLSAAKKIVSIGLGVAKQEDIEMVAELAKLLDAELGCSRPIAEGLDWLPRERYIGISGAFVKPNLYMAVGLSGQVQHTVGIGESKVIVAINKDKNAPIMKQCDYGIVGDLYNVVPALIKVLS